MKTHWVALVLAILFIPSVFAEDTAKDSNKDALHKFHKDLYYKNVRIVDKPFKRFEFDLVNKGTAIERIMLEVDFLDTNKKRLSKGMIVYAHIAQDSVIPVYIPIHDEGAVAFDLDVEDTMK